MRRPMTTACGVAALSLVCIVAAFAAASKSSVVKPPVSKPPVASAEPCAVERSGACSPISSRADEPAPAAPAKTLRRVALVIGNSAYSTVTNLPNPSRDAASMADLFRDAGFDTIQSELNLTISGMRKALREFSLVAETAEVAVVFFAGHAIEINGQNYLLPTDATLDRDTDVHDEAVPLDRVLELLSPAKRLKFVILDACRNNPFAQRIKITEAFRSIDRGFARPIVRGSSTLVAFATTADDRAADGRGQNSPFTAALVRRITQPGVDIRIALGEVHDDVLEATNGTQEPGIFGALGGSALFLGPARQQ